MEKKQTAVELLKETLDAEMKLGTKMVVNWDMYLEMEKEQIIESRTTSPITTGDVMLDLEEAQQYYNEIYSK